MRFILNFIFFGIVFYLIWKFFPDAFETLVSWMNSLYDVVRDLVVQAADRVKDMSAQKS